MDDFCLEGVRHKGKSAIDTIAGCFCPENKTRASSDSNICMDNCKFCIGPQGEPRKPGDMWRSNCYNCSCDSARRSRSRRDYPLSDDPVSVKCTQMIPPPPPTCGPTQVLVNRCCGLQDCVEKTCTYKGKITHLEKRGEIVKSHVCLSSAALKASKLKLKSVRLNTVRRKPELGMNITAVSHAEMAAAVLLQHRLVLAEVLKVKQSSVCCEEKSSESREVTLQCSNQTNMTYSYSHITGCKCTACSHKSSFNYLKS
ncbi:hypothetical protein WMY93_021653 [Mugilogobius chulae]|uniref:CTCK domain-containing protein n=1 Tax=Mugilogobius chulae TaxID=88201 RepID=A0AAW0NNH6_9GOBI